MVSVSVRYLFYQPMHEKFKTWTSTLRFPAKENPNILLFRERLSEKVHATILKGIVGGFEFTVL